MNYISDHKIRNTWPHHLPEQAMVDFDLDKLINNTYLQWQQVTPGTAEKAGMHIWKKHDINLILSGFKRQSGSCMEYQSRSQLRTGIRFQIRSEKRIKIPTYMDVLKNK